MTSNIRLAQATVVRPEYPRPQFCRSDWVNLNGIWEFAFDDADAGLKSEWWDGHVLEGQIIVPFPYQSEMSGINDKAIHPIVWYARNFEVPEYWKEKDILLHFGAVDYFTTVWVNGKEVGHNRGGHVPFSFNIAPYINAGENRLTVRVKDEQTPKQPRGKQSPSGKPARIYYYCTTGIWQTVWLEPVSPIRIEELKIHTPSSLDTIELTVLLHANSQTRRLEVEVLESLSNETIVLKEEAETRSTVIQVNLCVPGAKIWSPDDPHLYRLRLRLFEGDVLLDSVESYTGLRTVEVRDTHILLNGRATYLITVLDQGYWQQSYLAAPSDEALRRDVEWVKRFGFNSVRKHQKIEDPRWLYWCDQLGLLVWEEMPNAMMWSQEAEEDLLAEWKRAVRRDLNHPSIIIWIPVNESMGFRGRRNYHPAKYAFYERIVTTTRRLDPHRLVIDNDGWEHTNLTDICTIHDYTPDLKQFKARYENALVKGSLPQFAWHKKQPLFLGNAQYRGQPIILSEVGGILLPSQHVLEQQRDRLYNHYGYCTTEAELLEAYYELMKTLSSLTFLAGFSYTQLTDIEQEANGLLTYDRKPKIAPEEIAKFHYTLFQLNHINSTPQ